MTPHTFFVPVFLFQLNLFSSKNAMRKNEHARRTCLCSLRDINFFSVREIKYCTHENFYEQGISYIFGMSIVREK